MSNEESPRRRARELVLKRLYAVETGVDSPDDILAKVNDDSELSAKNAGFAKDYFLLVQDKVEWADELIGKLATNWKIERIASIDLIILRMALVELRFMPGSPVKVAINEAIELGKKYSTAGSASFINGILDSFAAREASSEAKSKE